METPAAQNQSPFAWANRQRLLLLLGIVFPLLLFTTLSLAIAQNQGLALVWDKPILLYLHQAATSQQDQLARALTPWGSFGGSLLSGSCLALLLWIGRRWRSLIYLLVTLAGAGLINRLAKDLFQRLRPSLWATFTPESGFSFPSGHAMASMALVVAVISLSWGSRWCYGVVVLGGSFVLTIAWTRLYLGVHYPSDILAGWLLALSWALGMNLLIRKTAH